VAACNVNASHSVTVKTLYAHSNTTLNATHIVNSIISLISPTENPEKTVPK